MSDDEASDREAERSGPAPEPESLFADAELERFTEDSEAEPEAEEPSFLEDPRRLAQNHDVVGFAVERPQGHLTERAAGGVPGGTTFTGDGDHRSHLLVTVLGEVFPGTEARRRFIVVAGAVFASLMPLVWAIRPWPWPWPSVEGRIIFFTFAALLLLPALLWNRID